MALHGMPEDLDTDI